MSSQKPNAELRSMLFGRPRDLHVGQFECSHPNKRFCILHCDWGPAQKKHTETPRQWQHDIWEWRWTLNRFWRLLLPLQSIQSFKHVEKTGKTPENHGWYGSYQEKIHVTNHQPRFFFLKKQSGECHWCHENVMVSSCGILAVQGSTKHHSWTLVKCPYSWSPRQQSTGSKVINRHKLIGSKVRYASFWYCRCFHFEWHTKRKASIWAICLFQNACTGKSWWFSNHPRLNTLEYGRQERRTYNLSPRHCYGITNEAARNYIKDHAWLPRNALASSPAFAIQNSWYTMDNGDNGLPVQSW